MARVVRRVVNRRRVRKAGREDQPGTQRERDQRGNECLGPLLAPDHGSIFDLRIQAILLGHPTGGRSSCSKRRQVSWLAGLGPCLAFPALTASGTLEARARRLQLRGQLRNRGFAPLTGIPNSAPANGAPSRL